MNDNELKTFLAIVETGSLVRASERLNVTQSTVTARLKALEEELGQRLIERRKSGATLTTAGLRLRRYAETIDGLWRQARRATALPGDVGAICAFGCHIDLWPGLGEQLPDLILTADPDAALSVTLASEGELAEALTAGLIDLALSPAAPHGAELDVREIAPDRLTLVSTNPNAPLRFDPGYVYVEAGEAFGRDHAIAYADANTARISFASAQPALDHLLTRGGSAYLPTRMTDPHIASGRLYALPDAPVFDRRIYLARSRDAAANWPWIEALDGF
ncbi:MAG: LysR family transcriptional regulator [Pseudomonadota bacterium]